MKLNLGSGASGPRALNVITLDQTGWKNIDICPLYETHECYDITTGIREPDNSVETIWMGDFFEHLTRVNAKIVLQECFRVLQKDGFILFSVPNMSIVMPLWLAGGNPNDKEQSFERCNQLIWGEQDEAVKSGNVVPDSHFAGYTEASLKQTLEGAGFSRVMRIGIHKCWYELAMIAYKG